MKPLSLILRTCPWIIALTANAEEQEQHFHTTVTKQVGAPYLVVIPEDHDATKKYPLLIFLHGRGEQGDDLAKVKIHGPFEAVKKLGLPLIIVAPQSPLGQWWDVDMLDALVDHLLETLPVDHDRVYLTGLSMGGHGTWLLAARRPETFAAIVPICGFSIPSKAASFGDLPIWVFHGANDKVIHVGESAIMVKSLRAVGNDARVTIYPSAGHDSWTETYNNPELYEWLLSKRRSERKTSASP